MNLRQTAEVSAIIATSAAHVVENPRSLPTESLHGYWKQSRTRLKCWFAGLRAGRSAMESGTTTSAGQTKLIHLSREILVTEMLTRVWSTVLTATDQRQQTTHLAATASHTYQGHMEARNEVLRLLVNEGDLPSDQQLSLERFRRRIERWTDALLGPLVAEYGVADYVFDTARARDFSSDSLQQSLNTTVNAHVPLLIAGLSAAIPQGSDSDRERFLLNRAVVRSILTAFPKGSFSSGGQVAILNTSQSEAPEHRAQPSQNPSRSLDDAERPVFGPGMNFTQIRRREQGKRSSSD